MPRFLVGVVILMLLVQGNAIAVSLRAPRRPVSAAESREKGRESVRTAIFVLVFAAVAVPRSWSSE